MRILRSLTGTLPLGKVSVMCAPTQCLEAETQTTRPSSVTSPDSPDGGWCVTGELKILMEVTKGLNNYLLDYDEIKVVGQINLENRNNQ